MDISKPNADGADPGEPETVPPRRAFLGTVAKATGGLLLAELAGATAALAQTPAAPAVTSGKFTDWG